MQEQPGELYALAVRFRQIATMMSDPETIAALRRKARECDEQAAALEDRPPTSRRQ